jgi:hypothetical protein
MYILNIKQVQMRVPEQTEEFFVDIKILFLQHILVFHKYILFYDIMFHRIYM